MSKHSPQTSLILHLPAFPSDEGTSWHQIPQSFHDWPVASINYRWDYFNPDESPDSQWPAPVHDVAFAYSWLLANLAPPRPSRRDMIVYGSYLGASLATSLALTESTIHAPFGVRSSAAYNGVYNWTMFLPEHPIHKRKGIAAQQPPMAQGGKMEALHDAIPDLFREPSNMFDPFASPSLFFHNPGLLIPRTLSETPLSNMISAALQDEDTGPKTKPPRKSHLVFPPRASTLKIPQTLLLHDRFVGPPVKGKRKTKQRGNTFATQADELAELMRRSVEKVELKDRFQWDDMDESDVAIRRVQTAEVEGVADYGLGADAQEHLRNWLDMYC